MKLISTASLVFVFVLLACVVVETRAAEVYMLPSLSYRAMYDDNFRMQNNGDSAFLEDRKLQIELGVIDPLQRLTLLSVLSSLDYDTSGEFDSDDQLAKLQYHFNGERFSAGGNIGFTRDGANAEQFDISGVFLAHNVRRETNNISLSTQYHLSPANLLSASASYSDRRYIDGVDSGLLGSEYLSTDFGLYRVVSAKLQTSISIAYSEFKSPDAGTTSDSYQLAIGGDWRLSETLDLNMHGGIRRSTSVQTFAAPQQFTSEESSNSPYFDARLEKSFQRSRLGLSFENTLLPGSEGELLTRRSILLSFDREQSERSSWGVASRFSTSEDAVLDDHLLREYGSVNTYYNYKLSRKLSVGLNLRYRWQENDRDNVRQESYASWLHIKWNADAWQF